METMILDRQALRLATENGMKRKAEYAAGSEEVQRKLLFQKVHKQYQQAWKVHEEGIQTAAKNWSFYDIPIIQFKTEWEHWNNAFTCTDGSRIIHWQNSSEYKVTMHALYKLFTKEVFHDQTTVRTFDTHQMYRALAWLVARKLARKFIIQKLNVKLLYVSVGLDPNYQKRVSRRSSTFNLWILRITWD